MNGTIVEYINGIEVIKAFNQGKASYAKFSDRVKANASYYYNWMKKSQFGVSMAYAIVPAALISILPVRWLLYQNGSLPVETFMMTIILSLGIADTLIAAMNFVDTLAMVGTTVAAVDELLSAEEQQHGVREVRFRGMEIEVSGRISVWETYLPRIMRWKRQGKPAVRILSRRCRMATIPSS